MKFPLSASSLDVFQKCPRLFFFRYLDAEKLYFPTTDRGRLGSQFHRLVELLSPLPPPSRPIWLKGVEPQVKTWWDAFCQAGLDQVEGDVYSEYPIELEYRGWRLHARFDRLVHHQGRYQIWDWKTSKVQNQTWQISLYPLLVHWGLEVPADRISIHFWYVNQGEEVFLYNDAKKAKDQAILDRTLEQISQGDFPKTTNPKLCQDCFFYQHCWGTKTP